MIGEAGWPGRGIGQSMNAAAIVIALIVLVVGCILGWHANRAHAAHGDIKTTHTRIANYRKTRMKSGLWAIGLIVVALFLLIAAIHK
jgi:ABC-type Fe3+ transport system permease subunit